jgi:hypothetical protein
MTGRDPFTFRPLLPPGVIAELEALQAAFPRYDIIVTRHGGQHRFEAIRRRGTAGPWCVITADARELRAILTGT